MKKLIILLLALFFISFDSGDLTSKSDSLSQISALESSSSKIEESNVADILQKLPLYFIENKGQVDERVQYQLKLSGMNVYFTSQEIVYQLFQREEGEAKVENIRVKFAGMNEEVEVEGGEESEAKVNYFIGNDPERWVQGARTYKKVIYRELYPDIDLIVYGGEGKIKHEYRVRAGGEVGDIRIKYEGVEGLRVNEEGELEVILKGGKLREGVPISYQRIDGERVEVKSGYMVMEDNVIGFRVGEYKKDRELVIDPVLTYSTFLGGSSSDGGYGIAADGSGNVYVTGEAESSDFPTTSGAYDTSYNGNSDVFITKLNSTGSALTYSTYLGGGLGDTGEEIAIDGSGNAYVTGYTSSSDFPTTSGAYDTSYNGNSDVFITKLNSTGSALTYSTYLGGGAYDCGHGIAIDGSGNAYVTGYTYSTDFPTTSGAFDTSYNGNSDVFITKLNSTGSALTYSTYLGGGDYDYGYGIAIDGSGNAYVTGYTYSTDFPTTSGAFDTSYNGNSDVFITKLNSTGSALTYSTYLGGGSYDYGYGIAIDGSGNAYVTGDTSSTDFPTTSGAFDTSYNGWDVFITKLNSTGSALTYSTYLGGCTLDYGYGIAIDGSGNAYVTGETWSSDFPTTSGAFDTSHNGSVDAFITKLNSTGSALSYSTYLGGSGGDTGYGIAVDGSGNVYLTGSSFSTDFPTTSGAYDTNNNGSADAFVTKFSFGIKDDLLGTWSGQGVYYRNSDTGHWVKLGSPATKIAAGDLDNDGTDDLLGIWPGQGGVWVKYSSSGNWALLSSTADWIGAGDMNGDGRCDFLGTWTGQGVYYRNSDTGGWVKMASPATQITAGDIDGDGTDDLIGIWPSQGGVWVKYSSDGTWERLSSTADWIGAGDMNGDGRCDLVGTWTGQGVYYRNSQSGSWVKMASPATMTAAGDLDGDSTDDLIGIWPAQGGVWVKYSSDGTWEKLSSTADWIAAGKMRNAGSTSIEGFMELPAPIGGYAEGPGKVIEYEDLSNVGPGGWNFVYQTEKNLVPQEEESIKMMRIPGPGEPGFKYTEQKNLIPQEKIEKKKKIRRK